MMNSRRNNNTPAINIMPEKTRGLSNIEEKEQERTNNHSFSITKNQEFYSNQSDRGGEENLRISSANSRRNQMAGSNKQI